MDDGELIFTNATTIHTVPEPTAGTRGLFALHIYQVGGTSPSLAVTIETKDAADASWTSAGSFTAATAVGTIMKYASSLKTLVRLALTMSGTNAWERYRKYAVSYLP